MKSYVIVYVLDVKRKEKRITVIEAESPRKALAKLSKKLWNKGFTVISIET